MTFDYTISVEPFDIGEPDEKAKKVLEEGSEACEAAREFLKKTDTLAELGRERRHVLYECCDAIQAAVNLMAFFGADNDEVADMMRKVTESNRSRGRYGSDGEGQDQARKNQGA